MPATPKSRRGDNPSDQDAAQLQQQIRALGDYAHVSVRAERGHLVISSQRDPIARLTPLAAGQYGLSFHNHTRRWEPMPFVGNLPEQAHNIVAALGIYLERWNLTDRNSGSDH